MKPGQNTKDREQAVLFGARSLAEEFGVWGKMVNAKVFLRLLRLTTAGAFCRFAQVLVDRMIFRGKIDRRNYDAWWLTLVHGKVF